MTVSISNMSQVWMSNANTYNAIAMSVSTMGYGANANSRLLLFKVDGNTKFSVDTTGDVNITGTYRINGNPISTGSGSMDYPYANAVGTAGNNYTVAVGNSGNIYANTVGVAGNNYAIAMDTAGNNYALGIGTAGNNYTVAIGASANSWSNTKLANTSGISFAGDLYFPTGNVGIGTITPVYKLDVAGVIRGQATAGSGDVLIIGNDTKLVDIDVAHSVGLYSTTNPTIGSIKLGSAGETIFGNSSNIGIGTSIPSSKLDVNGLIKDSKGDVRDLPFNSQTSPYALSSSDTGKVVSTTSNIFVASSIFSPGQAISIFNSSSATISIIANSGVTFRLAGQSNNSNRLLSQNGVATIICVAANNFVLSGAGLS